MDGNKKNIEKGKILRTQYPIDAISEFELKTDRPDILSFLEKSNEGRITYLLAERHNRLTISRSSFFRGMASIMAYDLSGTPDSQLYFAICGDCHLNNFGAFATPERNVIFDITDFDETYQGPWEWDLRRLAASIFIQGRENKYPESYSKDLVQQMVISYANQLQELSGLSTLEMWYFQLDADKAIKKLSNNKKIPKKKNKTKYYQHINPELCIDHTGKWSFIDKPPLIFHPDENFPFTDRVKDFTEDYKSTLLPYRNQLLNRYTMTDLAVRVSGVGSVGRRCAIALLVDEGNHPFVLQIKEAKASVLEPYLPKQTYESQAQRVVFGKRVIQSAGDLFLGWASDYKGNEYYFRQLRDQKISFRLDEFSKSDMRFYVEMCGKALARAHAKASDAAILHGYVGKGQKLAESTAGFARTYADINEKDFENYLKAVKSGKVITS